VDPGGVRGRELTPYRLDAASPDWSPNGKTILDNTFWDSPGGRASNIYAISPSGGHPTALTHDHAGKDFFAPHAHVAEALCDQPRLGFRTLGCRRGQTFWDGRGWFRTSDLSRVK
jgi:hypothetical protein